MSRCTKLDSVHRSPQFSPVCGFKQIVEVTKCFFTNLSDVHGAALLLYSIALYVWLSLFTQCHGIDGGAVSLNGDCASTLKRSCFDHCIAYSNGQVIYGPMEYGDLHSIYDSLVTFCPVEKAGNSRVIYFKNIRAISLLRTNFTACDLTANSVVFTLSCPMSECHFNTLSDCTTDVIFNHGQMVNFRHSHQNFVNNTRNRKPIYAFYTLSGAPLVSVTEVFIKNKFNALVSHGAEVQFFDCVFFQSHFSETTQIETVYLPPSTNYLCHHFSTDCQFDLDGQCAALAKGIATVTL